MTEFENWLNQEVIKSNRWRSRDEWAEDAWEAALRWVLEKAIFDPDDRGADYGIIPDIGFIEEELQN